MTTILTSKHAELARATGRRDGIAIERTPDALDEVQFAGEREMITRNLERESRLLRNVHAALDQIAKGAYGTCLECDEEISHKRLHAMPGYSLHRVPGAGGRKSAAKLGASREISQGCRLTLTAVTEPA